MIRSLFLISSIFIVGTDGAFASGKPFGGDDDRKAIEQRGFVSNLNKDQFLHQAVQQTREQRNAQDITQSGQPVSGRHHLSDSSQVFSSAAGKDIDAHKLYIIRSVKPANMKDKEQVKTLQVAGHMVDQRIAEKNATLPSSWTEWEFVGEAKIQAPSSH